LNGRAALSDHPTPKPVALVADAIRDCTDRGHLVLDPFLGSGTTVLAAERTGRHALGIEIDPLYVDTAIHRWQKLTGTAAMLANGKTFVEVSVERAAA
jgi:DNA modification methylase